MSGEPFPPSDKVNKPAPSLVRELTLEQKIELGSDGGGLSELARKVEPPGAARMAELGSRAGDYVRARGRSTIIFQRSIYRRAELQDLVMPARIAAFQAGTSQGKEGRSPSKSSPRICRDTPSGSVLLGRPAVDRTAWGHGLGAAYFIHALKRALDVSEQFGVHVVGGDALNEREHAFYVCLKRTLSLRAYPFWSLREAYPAYEVGEARVVA